MLQRFLKIYDALAISCIKLKKDFPFSAEEKKTVISLVNVLSSATSIISVLSSNKASLNTADLIISECITKLNKYDENQYIPDTEVREVL